MAAGLMASAVLILADNLTPDRVTLRLPKEIGVRRATRGTDTRVGASVMPCSPRYSDRR